MEVESTSVGLSSGSEWIWKGFCWERARCWVWMGGYLRYILEGRFWTGKDCLCKLFRKSEVILKGGISEIRINVGIGLGFCDLDLGLWKRVVDK